MEVQELVTDADVGVAETPAVEAVPEATPSVDGGVEDSTPAQVPSDDATRLQADIDRMKSASQRREYEMQQAYEAQMQQLQQYAIEQERQLFEAQTSGMDREQKSAAELQWQQQQRERQLQQRVTYMQSQMEQLTQRQQEQERLTEGAKRLAWLTGISEQELLERSSDPEGMLSYLHEELGNLRKQASRQPPEPPKVTSMRPSSPTGGINTRWAAMTAQERSDLIERAVREGIPANEL